MSATGYIQLHAYASNAQLPLEGVAAAITGSDGKVIALRLTNSSGQLDEPIPIAVPELSAGLTPNTGTIPFTTVSVYARIAGYEQIEVRGIQVFPNTLTYQPLALIPLAELPQYQNQIELFDTPKQNL